MTLVASGSAVFPSSYTQALSVECRPARLRCCRSLSSWSAGCQLVYSIEVGLDVEDGASHVFPCRQFTYHQEKIDQRLYFLHVTSFTCCLFFPRTRPNGYIHWLDRKRSLPTPSVQVPSKLQTVRPRPRNKDAPAKKTGIVNVMVIFVDGCVMDCKFGGWKHQEKLEGEREKDSGKW